MDVEIVERMQHVDQVSAEIYGFGGGEVGAWTVRVNVSANRGDRCHRSQLLQNVDIADIARVEDVVDGSQGIERFGAKKAVCIRDDADEHKECLRTSTLRSGIEQIAKTVSEEVEGEDADCQRRRREED